MITARRSLILAAFALAAVLILLPPHPCAQSEAKLLNSDAVDLFEQGRVHEALETLKVAQSQEPDDPVILANLGFIYQTLGRYNEAEGVLKKAIAIDPMNVDAHNILGICHYYLGNVERAISEWEWIIRVEPGNDAAITNIALARGEAKPPAKPAGREPAYGPAFEPLPRADYTLEELFYDAKNAYKQGKYQDAINMLSDVLEVKPNSLLSRYYLGLAFGHIGNREEALRHLREYLILESYTPGSPEAYKNARSIFDHLNKTGKMPSLDMPHDADAGKYFASGKKAYKQKDYFRAIHYLKEAVKRKPDSFPSNLYLGLSYGAVGDRERAVFHLTKCLILLDPSRKNYKKNKAHIQNAIESLIKK